jgi:thioredoxin-like negative regulator of GroEL
VKAFIQGEVVSEFIGLQTEDRLQDFISRLAPTPFDLILEKGASYLQMHSGNKLSIVTARCWMKNQITRAACWGWQKVC